MKKLKSNIYWCLLTIPLMLLVLFGLKKAPDALPVFSVESSFGTESISVFDAKDGNLYVFLPSYADLKQVTVSSISGRSVFLDETALTNGADCSPFQLETPYTLSINNKKIGNLWFYQSSSISAIHIDTASESMNKIHADKNTAELSSIRIFTADGTLNYHSSTSTLKGRGNSSWSYEKKPYTLSLEQSNNLLDLGVSSKWVLLANYKDETGLRNKLVYDYAASVGIYAGWSPNCAFVDLYLNGQYAGVYLLAQKIEVSPDYLNLSSNDYLMELMWANRTGTTSSIFDICPTRSVEVVYPANCSAEQLGFAEAYLQEFQEAIMSEDGVCKTSGKNWSEYIDMDSWARKYLVEEIFSNFDVGQASQYFWLNSADNKLYAGPCWDYDLTFGKQWGTTWYSPYSMLALRQWSENNSWFGALYEQAEFRERVISLYAEEFQPLLSALRDQKFPQMAQNMAQSISMNNIRWASTVSYEDGIAQISSYLQDRIAFLDSLWIKQDSYCTITIKTKETFNIYVPYNTVCTTLPQPEDLNQTGIWYDQATDQPFDASVPVCEDITLILKSTGVASASKDQPNLFSKEAIVILSVAALFGLFVCLAAVDFHRRWKERGKCK